MDFEIKHGKFDNQRFLSILKITPIFALLAPYFQKGGAKTSKNYRALCHVPWNNVLKLQKDRINFTEVIVNKTKVNGCQ